MIGIEARLGQAGLAWVVQTGLESVTSHRRQQPGSRTNQCSLLNNEDHGVETMEMIRESLP